MEPAASMPLAQEFMTQFARDTGLSPISKKPRRYLWTDSFAVCNFLELHRQTGDEAYMELALRLVDQVHTCLGRHREDDPRTGWISGLDEAEGKKHPTKGGLRIGKELRERRPDETVDERLEWDRDGQYYHYLTKWMHALNRLTRETGDFTYNQWAVELAKTAHSRFVYVSPAGGTKRMHWKMSVDLSYTLVPSMGQRDPLDGFITYHQLQSTTDEDPDGTFVLDLSTETADMAAICEGKSWATDDPLGIGGLLSDLYRIAQLMIKGHVKNDDLLEILLASSLVGLESYAMRDSLGLPADYRLAFRELGLSIGLAASEMFESLIEENPTLLDKDRNSLLKGIQRYQPMRQEIEDFWRTPANRKASSWTAHRDINTVMLATTMVPRGFLRLQAAVS